jgi:hypothetical protein
VTGVTGDVRGRGGMTGGTGGGAGSSVIGIAAGGVGGECGGARLAHRHLTSHPGTPCFDSFPRPVVSRVLLLEVREYTLSAVSGPARQ